jgi:AcrR family transcriptional regulator
MPSAKGPQPADRRYCPGMKSGSVPAGVLPRTRRGLETRAALVAGARAVFERDGFVNAKISDIAQSAGAATGSFYSYFANKEEIFSAVVDEMSEEMLHPRMRDVPDGDDVVAVIEAANRAYLDAYRRNAGLMAVLEQVTTINDDFRDVRRRRNAAFITRSARSIARLQAEGRADPELDPVIAARGVTGMVSRLAYQAFILKERMPFEQLVATSTRLWVNALQVRQTGTDPPSTQLSP